MTRTTIDKKLVEKVIAALIDVPTDREQVWLMDNDPQWREWALAALAAIREYELDKLGAAELK